MSIREMSLQEIRRLRLPEHGLDPISLEDFQHIVLATRAGQLYYGEPRQDVFHFLLNSGNHSPCYINHSVVLAESNLCTMLAAQLIVECDVAMGDVDWVVSGAMAGIPLGCEMSRLLGCRNGYVEKGSGGKRLEKWRFQIPENERVLVVNDLITTTDGTTWEIKKVVTEQNEFPVQFLPMAAVVVNRCKDQTLVDGTPVRHLFRFPDFPIHPPATCPFCAVGSPLVADKTDWRKFRQATG